MTKIFSRIILTIIVVLTFMACDKEKFEVIKTDFEYELTITSGLSNNLPIDNLTEIDLETFAGDTIYFFVEWLDLENKNYFYEGSVYDPSGNLAYEGQLNVNGVTGKANTYTFLAFKETGNPTGWWSFEAKMDDELAAKVNFEVK